MGKTNYAGIDYGMGRSNIDTETGIRYGVIHHSAIGQSWYESSESEYPAPCCPKCGDEAVEYDDEKHGEYNDWDMGCSDYACESCEHYFDLSCDESEPIGHFIKDDEYHAYQGNDDCDVMVFKSPYYTKAQFCSPCAPGAGYLANPCDSGPKTYCFGNDWFDSDRPCPYPVYRIEDDVCIYTPDEDAE